MTTLQVARRLGVSTTRVIQLAKAGRIRHDRTPLGRLFDPDSVEELVEQRARAAFAIPEREEATSEAG